MKAVRSILFAAGIFVSGFSFGQLNTVVKSTTQATVNATNAVKASTTAAQSTHLAVNRSGNKMTTVKTRTKHAVSNQTGMVKKDVKKSTDVKANAKVSAQSNTKVNNEATTNSSNAKVNSDNSTKAGASVNVDGSKAKSTTAATAKKVSATTTEKVKATKTKVEDKAKSDAAIKLSVTTKADAKTTVKKQ